SLGGWGGCETCSPVFATEAGRKEFARSVKRINRYFKTDGIDLDWEYPAIPGPPGHPYAPEDKQNFTLLIKALRKALGKNQEISFAAGGFTKFLNESVEWDKVVPLVNNINLMTYDLVHGYSTTTGHHTPLYSTPEQIESTDHAVRMLDSMGVPKNKLVIGAAFYARIFDVEQIANNGLYQPGKFKTSLSYMWFNKDSLQQEGFTYHWDDVAKAPYLFSDAKKQLITLDDEQSVMLKTKYTVQQRLYGIMFWQLASDKTENGLLEAINKVLRE
ncbi:MAG: glycoside hydrolase, partial [Flavisolibacter sp.]|nr:glycoside hydrolase [Flavisolibacter sp.]